MKKNRILIKNKKQISIDKTKGRLVLLSIAFFMLYSLVAARLFDLTVLQGGYLQEESYETSNDIKNKQIRADIVDRNGILLARSLNVPSLYADPKLVLEPKSVAQEIIQIFPDLSYGTVLKKLQSNNRFTWIKRNIEPADQQKIVELGRPGLSFKNELMRIYPQENLTSHIVGVSGVDGQGLAGIEAEFDGLLSTKSSVLKTSIDVRIQHIMKREMQKTIKLHEAIGGSGIVMDVNTGEVLAVVSLPDYSPDSYSNDNKNIFNRATLGVYEMGSTFKIFSTAALIEKNNKNLNNKYDATEPLKIGRFRIRDYHPEKRELTVPEVFIHSSNIGTALMAQDVGSDYIKTFYKNLGLMNKPNFEIGELGNPMIPSPWGEVHTMTTSYGHGIAVSALQLVKAASIIVNGGYDIEPTLILNEQKNSVREAVISTETSHRLRQLLRLNVAHGTGSKADVKGYLVGGKTGTAEKPGKGGYKRNDIISSFLGFFPMDKPQYAVFVMIDEPKGVKETYGYATGGWVGAPTVSRVIYSMATVLGIEPQQGNKFGDSLLRYVKTKEQVKKEQQIAAH